jgi:hypothetical protein
MGFIAPTLPGLDLKEWRSKPHLQRIKPLAQDWAENGFGTPYAVYLLYVVKLFFYVGGAIAVIAWTTPGLTVGEFGEWWTEPVAYQKFVAWTIVYEILGLGCGSMPLTFRFLPPIGGFLYWLRPGMVRLPPWPGRVPLTAGTTRSWVDVALYAGVVLTGIALLASNPSGTPVEDASLGTLEPSRIVPVLVLLGLLGLRDKTAFLASRPEQYALYLIIFLFPPTNLIFAAKLVMVATWWGAATSKLNRHFPFVVAAMVSNTPWQPKYVKRRMWRQLPDDMTPSRYARFLAHVCGTTVEFGLPLVLLLSDGGLVTTVTVAFMVLFHLHITSTFPLGVPLEWNLFMIYSTMFLFGHYAATGPSGLESPLLVALLVGVVAMVALGNARPDLLSFLPSMRYYAGNWATSVWLFRKDGAEDLLDEKMPKVAPVVVKQLTTLYGEELAELMLYKGLAWRAMHTHGRALTALMPRAVDDLEMYDIREGEFTAGAILGWNFGEGHLHNETLLAAVQERCHFEPGELRVVILESQPMQRQTQHYRIVDAAIGLVEEGHVEVRDMAENQPWLDESGTLPIHALTVQVPAQATGEQSPRDAQPA